MIHLLKLWLARQFDRLKVNNTILYFCIGLLAVAINSVLTDPDVVAMIEGQWGIQAWIPRVTAITSVIVSSFIPVRTTEAKQEFLTRRQQKRLRKAGGI